MKTTIRNWAQDDRPKEKLIIKGSNSLSNTELLAILIGSGTKNHSAIDISRNILEGINNDINLLFKQNLDQLLKYEGIGQARGVTICAAIELSRRRQTEKTEKITIGSSKSAFDIIASQFKDLLHEEFYVVFLNRANQVLSIDQISKGGLSGTIADGKVIFKKALEKQSSALILAHNHPSGNLKPSDADLRLTKSLIKFSRLIDLQILDHIIVAENNYFSFADEGLMI